MMKNDIDSLVYDSSRVVLKNDYYNVSFTTKNNNNDYDNNFKAI